MTTSDRQFYAEALKDLYCSEKIIRPIYALPVLRGSILDSERNPFVPSEKEIAAATTYFRAVWTWYRDEKRKELLALSTAAAKRGLEDQFAQEDHFKNFEGWLETHIYGKGGVWSFVDRIARAPDEETWWRTVAVAPLGGMFLNEIASQVYRSVNSNFPVPKEQLRNKRDFYLAEQGIKSGYLTHKALERAGYTDLNETFGMPATPTYWGPTTCCPEQYFPLLCATVVRELDGWIESRAGSRISAASLYDDQVDYSAKRLDFHMKSFLIPYIREQAQRAQANVGEPRSVFVTLPDGQRYPRPNYTFDAFQDVKKYNSAIIWLRNWLGWGTDNGYVLASNNLLKTTDIVPARLRTIITWIDTPYLARPIGDMNQRSDETFPTWLYLTAVLKKAGFDTDEEILDFARYYTGSSIVATSFSGAELPQGLLIPALAVGGVFLIALYYKKNA